MTVLFVSVGNRILAQERGYARQNKTALISQISQSCESTKRATIQDIMQLQRPNPKTELMRQINLFRDGIRKSFPIDVAQEWETLLLINNLQQTLRQDEADLELVDDIHAILSGNAPELQRPAFILLKKSLETHRPRLWRQNQQFHVEDVEMFFDSLPGQIERYLASPDTDSANAVSEALSFLDESSETRELTTLIRTLLVQPNLRVRVRSEMIAPLFLRDIDEPVTVNENILGTWVRGFGQMTGKSNVAFVPNRDSAVIRVTFQGMLSTTTVGTNSPVRVHSKNTTALTSVKDIIITKKAVTTSPASTHAKQSSQILHVDYLRRGPLVQLLAPDQIRERKPASDAESERLTRLRLNKRVDTTVDENMGQFAELFQKIVGGQVGNKSLRLDFNRMFTTDKELLAEAVTGNRFQLTTLTEPPVVKSEAGLFLQLHESLANNAGDCELSGRTLVEEQVFAELKERFPTMLENEDATDMANEPSLTITFSDRPVKMSFAANVIKVAIKTTAIERGGNLYPDMEIEFQFRIEAADDGYRLVATGPPEVLPLGFDRENGQLSARETTIRAIIMKKLERITEKPIEWKESKIEMKAGTMTVRPAHLSAANGWLSVGLDLVEWTAL